MRTIYVKHSTVRRIYHCKTEQVTVVEYFDKINGLILQIA